MIAPDHRCSVALSGRLLVLRLHPDPVLRTTCQPLKRAGRDIEALARDMLALMRRRHGIGLAAPQVGLSIRLIVASTGNETVCVADPEISAGTEAESAEEGCLSLPNISVEVTRPLRIEVRGRTPGGRRLHFAADGLLARVLQHEVDHLNGVLIIDHGPPVSRRAPVGGFLS
jgi:peptide deformylase